MEFLYNSPTSIIFGAKSSQKAGEIFAQMGCKKVLCVHGKVVKKTGIIDPIVSCLQEQGIQVVEFSEVIPDPPIDVVERGAAFAKAEKVDGVLAVGGGSAMDTAKAINILLGNEGALIDYMGFNTLKNPGKPLIAVPTTSGTASEVTTAAVVTDTVNQKKLFCTDVKLSCNFALLDPELTVSMPKDITVATGMDALAHAVESVTCAGSTPLTEASALGAVKLIWKNLPKAFADGSNIEARENMLLGSVMAGIAFSNSYVHLGHSIAHVLGAHFHIAHGVACAMAMPYILDYAGKAVPGKLKLIGEAMGLSFPEKASDQEIVSMVTGEIAGMRTKLEIPTLKKLGIAEDSVLVLKQAVMEEPLVALCPNPVTEEAVAEILKKIYRE